jgi:hypothetical protein
VDELAAEFEKLEEWCPCLKKSGARAYDLILGLPSSQVQLGDRLDDIIRHFQVKQVACWEVDGEVEALQSSVAQVWDLVLERPDMTSSLAVALSSVAEFIDNHIDAPVANGAHWDTWSALAAALSHFPELGTELEVLGSGRNTDLREDQVNAL